MLRKDEEKERNKVSPFSNALYSGIVRVFCPVGGMEILVKKPVNPDR